MYKIAFKMRTPDSNMNYIKDTMGSSVKSIKTLYFLLSKRVPLDEIREYLNEQENSKDRIDLMLSLFLNTASLITEQEFESESDAKFSARLDSFWKPLRHYFSDRMIPPTRRWYAGMRPPGFPMRRLTAVSILVHRLLYDQLFQNLRQLVEKEAPVSGTDREWKAFFKKFVEHVMVTDSNQYFASHYTLGGKEIKPQALLGEPAARVMIFNVILPLLILQARSEKNRELEDRIWEVMNVFPSLADNSITKMMQVRLFGDSGVEKSLMKREITQQALYKIFEDCCSWNEQTCDSCTFFRTPLADQIN